MLCSLVAGFLLAFAIAVMPGLKNLDDREFLRAFQQIDGVIQNRQPVFMVLWIGSVAMVLTVAVLGMGQLDGLDRMLVLVAAALYLLGVQLPTFAINIPLNNRLQSLEVEALPTPTLRAARQDFEARWNRWNAIRTGFATVTSVQLMFVLFRLPLA